MTIDIASIGKDTNSGFGWLYKTLTLENAVLTRL
jgi:hypothetical protein